jgi:hypothetical protein
VLADSLVLQHKKEKLLFTASERQAQVKQALELLSSHKHEVSIIHYEKGFFAGERADTLIDNYIVVGSDWLEKDVLAHWGLTQRDLQQRRLNVFVVPYTAGISTSTLKERIRNGN